MDIYIRDRLTRQFVLWTDIGSEFRLYNPKTGDCEGVVRPATLEEEIDMLSQVAHIPSWFVQYRDRNRKSDYILYERERERDAMNWIHEFCDWITVGEYHG